MDPAPLLFSLAGGTLIGLAAFWLWHAHGRIAGISGITGYVVRGGAPRNAQNADEGWRPAFLVGLVAMGAALGIALPASFGELEGGSPMRLIVAGLLVGVGTQLGSGCTSGHGVCGIGRGSKRSLSATIVFMGVAAMVVFAMGAAS